MTSHQIKGTPYCPFCSAERACGNYHVYVIALEKDVKKNRTFKKENPHLKGGNRASCFYVGMTSHKPECRFEQHIGHYQHRIDYAQDKDTRAGTIQCSCDGTRRKKIFKPEKGKQFVWGSKIPGRYGIELVPELFYERNPIRKKADARAEEKALARALRKQGFGASVGGEEVYRQV